MNVAGETEEIAGGQGVCRRGRLVEAVADGNVHRPSADDHDAFVGPVKVGLNLVSSRELRAGYEEAALARTPLERGDGASRAQILGTGVPLDPVRFHESGLGRLAGLGLQSERGDGGYPGEQDRSLH